MHRKRLALIVAALAVTMGAATAVATAAGSLTGAGSTLITPLMAQWQAHSGINIQYGSVGSGMGISDITARSVDFGASDAPLTPAQAAACNGCVQIPWALTATAIGFHVNGIRTLHLTGPVVAKIYLGQIGNWDSGAIKALNKHTHLPNLKITPVYRSDSSGDTYAFTDFLSRISSSWAHRVGNATAVNFPAGIGAAKNSGMAFTVAATNGAIGYIAASYLLTNHAVSVAALQNAAGNYEYPNLPNIADAAKSITKVPSSNALHIVDPPSTYSTAYPLSTFTYAIVPKASSNASTLAQLIKYAVGSGQQYGPALDFSPLPKVVKNAAIKAANSLTP